MKKLLIIYVFMSSFLCFFVSDGKVIAFPVSLQLFLAFLLLLVATVPCFCDKTRPCHLYLSEKLLDVGQQPFCTN